MTDRIARRAAGVATPHRAEAIADAARELRAWRASAMPDPTVPLDAEDVARLVVDCFAALGVDPAVGAGFSVNTVHYYRRRDVIDAPVGRTSSARYGIAHLWQAAAARLAGQLGLVTLDEARRAIRGRDEQTLIEYLAARVADARGRIAARRSAAPVADVARALPAAPARSAVVLPNASLLPLGDEAWCVIPAAHPALRSTPEARALLRALARALHVGGLSFDP